MEPSSGSERHGAVAVPPAEKSGALVRLPPSRIGSVGKSLKTIGPVSTGGSVSSLMLPSASVVVPVSPTAPSSGIASGSEPLEQAANAAPAITQSTSGARMHQGYHLPVASADTAFGSRVPRTVALC